MSGGPMTIDRGCLRGVVASVHARLLATLRRHLLADTQGPHVDPRLLDVGEAIILAAGLVDTPPPKRRVPIDWPDRVLLLVIHDDAVDHALVGLVHGYSHCLQQLPWRARAGASARHAE